MDLIQQIANRNTDSLWIELNDVKSHDAELFYRIKQNTKRYVELFAEVIDMNMPQATESYELNMLDIMIRQRQQLEVQQEVQFPSILKRRFGLFFVPEDAVKILSVRQIKAEMIGTMVSLQGIVTRVSDVKPLLSVCTYSCDECGHELFQEIKSRTVMPLSQCQSPICVRNRKKGKLFMQIRASKFLRFQELRIQELTDQVPMGHIPRSMTVHLYEGMTRQINTGDQVILSGIFLPTPYTGFRAIRAGLLADTYLEGLHVQKMRESYDVLRQSGSELRIQSNLYSALARSICPEIYGSEDVKKALLLQLVGGVTKNLKDGMKIRGEINVLLMGDPGVAKSQLLKWVSKATPRGVYTTGKGSSGVGLTAAVMKDSVTGELVLEGGALVLADNGVCCIDEFDKMEDTDKTAIHEVMEQQTISISKAGIVTTLNARTSILAAANPIHGRYNPSLSVNQNINLPAALLSRFDIVFLILDSPNLNQDTSLAQHVTHVHMNNAAPENEATFTAEQIKSYVARARGYRPTVARGVLEYLTETYVGLRKDCEATPRTLVGILRLSQALARLRLSTQIETDDVDEAVRLMRVSQVSIERKKPEHHVTRIFNILKQMDGNSLQELKQRVIAKGLTEPQLEETLREYSNLGVIIVDGDKINWV